MARAKKDDLVPFCGVVSMTRAPIAEVIAAWNKRALLWAIRGQLPGITPDLFRATAAAAFGAWQRVGGLSFAEASAGQAPDIIMNAGRIDGPQQVLAWSELPDGSDRALAQMYDTSERFVVAETPARGFIDLLAVMTHEIGHALGLDHAPQSSPDLMAPYYRPGLRVPQTGDVARIQRLYGGPRPPAPVPPTPGVKPIIIEIYGADSIVIPGYKVTKE